MPNNHIFDEQVGLLRTGTIIGFNEVNGTISVKLNNASATRSQMQSIDVPMPHSMFFNNGLFVGAKPSVGTPVVIGQGSGGQHYFVSFLSENKSLLPTLEDDTILIKSNNKTQITLNALNNIQIGSPLNKINILTDRNLITTNINNKNSFSQASRNVEGLIKRDLKINTNFDFNSKLENDDYDSKYFVIGMDPTVASNNLISGTTKNPPFVEKREIVYEFQYSSDVSDDLSEQLIYSGNKSSQQKNYTLPNRRKSRADTLSLALSEPNYLMETIKGTVVDIFGNILDLNRVPLPIGQEQNTINATISTDKVASFKLIKELERKSIAYHFELNARKDLTAQSGTETLPDINSNVDYARSRSRFFIDIDKEGVFKINIPSSSEKGNVPILTRYENYSLVGDEDDNNPNKLIFREDNLDILHDSFAAPKFNLSDGSIAEERGSITLKNNGSDGAPIDRITQAHIKHGTAYHDILNTCYAHQQPAFLGYVLDKSNPIYSYISSLETIEVAKNTIELSGDSANAGGRSGSISLDGSVDVNIGANTVDRQSLWMDLAGGIIANVGRDNFDKSAAISMNGNVFFQIGGMGVTGDSRFVEKNNGQIGAVLDLRVFNSGNRVTMIRIDDNGTTIITPGNMFIHSGGDMRITSDCDINIECENLTLQNRKVMKNFGGSI